jgi:predicted NBD/HSP70 family sugar kinase
LALAENGVLGEVVRQQTDPSAAGFAKFLGVVQEMTQDRRISAVAGSFPLQLRGDGGEVVVATNLPLWLGLKVRLLLEQIFDCPVIIGNDMAMCGLGEANYGAGITEGVMAYYTVSTGVNAARIVDGEVDPTISRFELGYQVVNQVGGKRKSLEDMIGGRSIAERFGKKPPDIHDEAVWRELESSLAVGVYNTMLFWNPEVIVFGGSMMRDLKLDRVAAELAQMPQIMERLPRLEYAKLGDDVGLRGAMAKLEMIGYK